MTIETIKFSQMTDGGDLANNEKTPGLLNGANVLFNNPWTFLPPGTTAERPTPSTLINYRLRFNTDEQLYEYYDAILGQWTQLQESAFTQGPFVTYTADSSLPDAQNLGALANGILKQTLTLGVADIDIAVLNIDYYGPGMNPLPVTEGGTERSSATAYALIAGGITATGAHQSLTTGSLGQLLQSQGSAALADWTTAAFPIGPGTLNHLLRSDGTDWVETTNVTIDAMDVMSGITQLNVDNLRLDGNTISSTDTNGNVYIQPNGTGKTVVTNVSTPSTAFLGSFGIVTSAGSASQTITSYTANTGQSSQMYLAKSNSTVPGVFSALGASEVIGQFRAWGDDGTQFTESCNIRFFVNGTVSSGIVPGQIQFLTANSAGAMTQALAIDSAQQATFTNNIIQSGFLRGITEIQDSVANVLLDFATGGGTPFNYFQITNNPTGSGPNLNALGGDADVGMNFTAKAAGRFFWRSTHATPFVILNGTAYQRTNQFNFPDLSGNFAYTFPAATGTIALTADLTGYVTAVNGTANRITSTGGTTPTIDISASYVGQSSITTLGTIATGVWQGTLVSPIYGGTGVNNGSNTLTLAGTLATSGAFASVFTMTGATNVTFPTSGTLLTSAGAVTSITGTANQVIASASTGAVTLSLPQSIATSSSPTFTTVTGTTSIVAGAAGSPANYLVSVAPGASLGNIVISAVNSAGNFNGFLVNASMSATRTWTLPDATGTIALTSGASGIVNSGTQNQLTWYAGTGTTVSGLATANNGILVTSAGGVPSIGNTVGAGLTMPSVTFNSTSGIIGTTTNDSAAVGSVGQLVSAAIVEGSAVSRSSGTQQDVTSISLTAGDWDIWGNVSFIAAATTTVTTALAWISSTSATIPNAFVYTSTPRNGNLNSFGIVAPSFRVSLSGTTTYYLSTFQVFAIDTLTACGGLYARRRR